ncbi:hypothetical protein DQ04_12911020 [Trypanosoma grayi]|uniref:hypothetical protein n=1 Tax=Trypanosoma grayi TaxID=71804 RepID=UPI0004F46CC6|nr:hypothetical protein DQ04_12911020 [Trypanosoma grayi]KEG06652.1 hypothetical protein DQ04_12911020 [Trypanosoma grayi]
MCAAALSESRLGDVRMPWHLRPARRPPVRSRQYVHERRCEDVSSLLWAQHASKYRGVSDVATSASCSQIHIQPMSEFRVLSGLCRLLMLLMQAVLLPSLFKTSTSTWSVNNSDGA